MISVRPAITPGSVLLTAFILNLLVPSVAEAGKVSVVYSFQGGSDGAIPNGALIDVGGVFYGTTTQGGAFDKGTVYSVTPQGVETVLYSFNNSGGDAEYPASALTELGGLLYGTAQGGAHNKGTIFSVTPAGVENVVFSFADGRDGTIPEDGLLAVGGTLYGAAAYGGGDGGCGHMGCGTVFALRPGHRLKILHNFTNNPDGAYPEGIGAPLIDMGGVLYGTTRGGGVNGGTVYSITRQGVENVIYSFHGADGWAATPSLLAMRGVIYGTTEQGGNGAGTVFSVTPQGVETVLYMFSGGGQGIPLSGLTRIDSILYGTTAGGGCYEGSSCGNVYKISTEGAEKTVHSFKAGSGPGGPEGNLIDVGGALYGTTVAGGSAGWGTVYKVER